MNECDLRLVSLCSVEAVCHTYPRTAPIYSAAGPGPTPPLWPGYGGPRTPPDSAGRPLFLSVVDGAAGHTLDAGWDRYPQCFGDASPKTGVIHRLAPGVLSRLWCRAMVEP